MPRKTIYTLEEVCAILPHRAPFLFVDRVIGFSPDRMIETERQLHEKEPFFAGHFPGMPIMPGVLVTDALAQTCGLLFGFSRMEAMKKENRKPDKPQEIFFLAAANIKFINPSYPGDTLLMSARPENNFGQLFTYEVEAVVKRKVIAKGRLTLAMMKGDQ